MPKTPDPRDNEHAPDLPYESVAETAGARGSDDRKSSVNPAENPAPRSPEPDADAIRRGEEDLNRVSPH